MRVLQVVFACVSVHGLNQNKGHQGEKEELTQHEMEVSSAGNLTFDVHSSTGQTTRAQDAEDLVIVTTADGMVQAKNAVSESTRPLPQVTSSLASIEYKSAEKAGDAKVNGVETVKPASGAFPQSGEAQAQVNTGLVEAFDSAASAAHAREVLQGLVDHARIVRQWYDTADLDFTGNDWAAVAEKLKASAVQCQEEVGVGVGCEVEQIIAAFAKLSDEPLIGEDNALTFLRECGTRVALMTVGLPADYKGESTIEVVKQDGKSVFVTIPHDKRNAGSRFDIGFPTLEEAEAAEAAAEKAAKEGAAKADPVGVKKSLYTAAADRLSKAVIASTNWMAPSDRDAPRGVTGHNIAAK